MHASVGSVHATQTREVCAAPRIVSSPSVQNYDPASALVVHVLIQPLARDVGCVETITVEKDSVYRILTMVVL